MRRVRKACQGCGAVVMHLDGKPMGAHLQSRRHNDVDVIVVREEKGGRLWREKPKEKRVAACATPRG